MDSSYNDRLFKSGLRKHLHFARFHWLRGRIQGMGTLASVLELGCFDGKTLEFLPEDLDTYHGYDANWEAGLDLAREKWKERRGVEFFESDCLSGFRPKKHAFDISICMETLEHLPPPEVDQYLSMLADATRKYALVTVPNEIGPVFATKYIAKRVRYGRTRDYTRKEFLCATLGRLDRVARNHHKGFDYRRLVEQMRRHFDVIEVTGLPFSWLPPSLNFTVALVARPKHLHEVNSIRRLSTVKAA
ncbi:MAG: class I SAM-dependent methyltransferase [Pirellulales bacterium]|nr:class I SAM-dependent methyltransferase [Pirellulales bacterium]